MRVLVATGSIHGHLLGGCRLNEMVQLSVPLGARGDRLTSCSWIGIQSRGQSLVAKVQEPPPCFNLKPELATDELVVATLRIAEQYPVGTVLSVAYDWDAEPCPGDISLERVIAAWKVSVVGGPN